MLMKLLMIRAAMHGAECPMFLYYLDVDDGVDKNSYAWSRVSYVFVIS